jgi:hypothetical protein
LHKDSDGLKQIPINGKSAEDSSSSESDRDYAANPLAAAKEQRDKIKAELTEK